MHDEVQLIKDDEGLAVIGDRSAVERFLESVGLLSLSTDLGRHRLGELLQAGTAALQAGSGIAANSARWLKLTPESAQAVKDLGLVETSTPGVSYAMVGNPGSIVSWLRVENTRLSQLTNPAVLAGAAGMLQQLALQHERNELKVYLARIDSKVDDVLRALDNEVASKLIGTGLDIENALAILEEEGRVDDDTWSTVQGRTQTISDTLGWVSLQFKELAEKVEEQSKPRQVATTARDAQSRVPKLLTLLGRCLELQDALDMVQLSRLLEASPEQMPTRLRRRQQERQKQRELVLSEITHFMTFMVAAADRASLHVLLHAPSHRSAVRSLNAIGVAVADFHRPLGEETRREPVEATPWLQAARDPHQLKNAGAEAGKALALAAVGGAAGAAVLSHRATGEQENGGEPSAGAPDSPTP